MKLKIYITTVAFLLSSIGLVATSDRVQGNYGWKMLVIPPNTSISAMSGTGANLSPEAEAFMSHPTAGLFGDAKRISLSQNSWYFNTTINSAAISVSKGSKAYGFAVRSLDYGKFDARDISGEIIGEFHPLDLNLAGNFAFRMTPNYYAGINIFILYQKIDSSSSLGLAADAGITYVTPMNGLNINAALKHIGGTTKVKNDGIKLPLTPELGFGYTLPASLDIVYTELKFVAHPDDDDIKMVFGSNVSVTSAFDLRFGYKVNYDSQDFTAGLGLNLRNMVFNYAYLPFKFDGNDAHSFGLTYKF